MSEIQSELATLEYSDDANLTDEEFESKMSKEEELLEEEIELGEEMDTVEGVAGYDDDDDDKTTGVIWDDLLGEMGADNLEEELVEVEQDIEGAFHLLCYMSCVFVFIFTLAVTVNLYSSSVCSSSLRQTYNSLYTL
jgi:hypothetical protein